VPLDHAPLVGLIRAVRWWRRAGVHLAAVAARAAAEAAAVVTARGAGSPFGLVFAHRRRATTTGMDAELGCSAGLSAAGERTVSGRNSVTSSVVRSTVAARVAGTCGPTRTARAAAFASAAADGERQRQDPCFAPHVPPREQVTCRRDCARLCQGWQTPIGAVLGRPLAPPRVPAPAHVRCPIPVGKQMST
jgi:hypothetical protein